MAGQGATFLFVLAFGGHAGEDVENPSSGKREGRTWRTRTPLGCPTCQQTINTRVFNYQLAQALTGNRLGFLPRDDVDSSSHPRQWREKQRVGQRRVAAWLPARFVFCGPQLFQKLGGPGHLPSMPGNSQRRAWPQRPNADPKKQPPGRLFQPILGVLEWGTQIRTPQSIHKVFLAIPAACPFPGHPMEAHILLLSRNLGQNFQTPPMPLQGRSLQHPLPRTGSAQPPHTFPDTPHTCAQARPQPPRSPPKAHRGPPTTDRGRPEQNLCPAKTYLLGAQTFFGFLTRSIHGPGFRLVVARRKKIFSKQPNPP